MTPPLRGRPQSILQEATLGHESKARTLTLWVAGLAGRAGCTFTLGFAATLTCWPLGYTQNFSRETDQPEDETAQRAVSSCLSFEDPSSGVTGTSLELGREACPAKSSLAPQLDDNETHCLRRWRRLGQMKCAHQATRPRDQNALELKCKWASFHMPIRSIGGGLCEY